MVAFLTVVVTLLAVGLVAADRVDGRGRVVLLIGLPVSAMVLGASGVIFDANELSEKSDCVGQCVGDFAYNAPIVGALAGGIAFVGLLIVAVGRLVLGRPSGRSGR